MEQVKQIGYLTTINDIKQMVLSDFGVMIDTEQAKNIFEANNKGQLVWTPSHIKSVGRHNFTIDSGGYREV